MNPSSVEVSLNGSRYISACWRYSSCNSTESSKLSCAEAIPFSKGLPPARTCLYNDMDLFNPFSTVELAYLGESKPDESLLFKYIYK